MKGAIQTEFQFTLPVGYDATQKEGTMRLVTASEETSAHKDPRVQQNPAYLIIILLSMTITKLGSLQSITPQIIESLYSSDLTFLQELYTRINHSTTPTINVKCPKCEHSFEIEM
jgi:hypothetical protein